jgi:hypothetical protein
VLSHLKADEMLIVVDKSTHKSRLREASRGYDLLHDATDSVFQQKEFVDDYYGVAWKVVYS